MARYIDADKLAKDVLASWDKDNHKTLEASRVHRQEHHHLMSIIEKQPTADVVPQTECDRIMQEKTALECIVGTARNQARADTVKKMQELIKERCIEGGIYPAFVAKTIDQIAKEILEGDPS